jgi:protein TonB
VATATDNASKPTAQTSARTDEKAVTSQPEKAATSAKSTKKQLRAGASQKTDNYLSKLVRHLSAYRDYPRRARRLGLQGTPVVMFELIGQVNC